MSGIFGGGRKSTPAAKAKTEMAAPAAAPKADGVMQAEDSAARRRARRGGRGMLSDTRLNPEQGVSTLGTTGL
jgi:hypothetical protein